jgi:hypothetical protein
MGGWRPYDLTADTVPEERVKHLVDGRFFKLL